MSEQQIFSHRCDPARLPETETIVKAEDLELEI